MSYHLTITQNILDKNYPQDEVFKAIDAFITNTNGGEAVSSKDAINIFTELKKSKSVTRTTKDGHTIILSHV
jgi:hypothetical protein